MWQPGSSRTEARAFSAITSSDYLAANGVEIVSRPHDHKNDPGVSSFYCLDPAGNSVQPLYHPAVSGQRFEKS